MDVSEETNSEDELKSELNEADVIGKELVSQGRLYMREGQWILDIARATRDIVEYAPQLLNQKSQTDLWREINKSGKISLQKQSEANISLLIASSTATTSSASVDLSTDSVERIVPHLACDQQEHAKEAINNFHVLTSRSEIKDEVVSLICFFGFDKSVPGKRSSLEQFITAFQAFENPVSDSNPVMTSLIPMRQSIESIISELLRRRITQEKTGSNHSKFLSFGLQLKRNELSENVVSEWASQWDKLVDELSDTKQCEMMREEWGHRLQRATLFISGLLKGLDPSKVNRKIR